MALFGQHYIDDLEGMDDRPLFGRHWDEDLEDMKSHYDHRNLLLEILKTLRKDIKKNKDLISKIEKELR